MSKSRLSKSGLRIRILTWSFVPTAIILLAVAFTILYAYQQVTEDLISRKNSEVARLAAAQVSSNLQEYSSLLSSFAQNPDIRLGIDSLQQVALARAAGSLERFDGGIFILDSHGSVNAVEPSRPDMIGQDWSYRAWYAQTYVSMRPVFSGIVTTENEDPVVIVAVPIIGDQNAFRGVVGGILRLRPDAGGELYQALARQETSATRTTLIVDSSGRLLYHSDAGRLGSNLYAEPTVQLVLTRQAGSLRTRDEKGTEILAAFAPVPGTSWGLVTEESWAAVLASSGGYGPFLFALLALGVIIPALVVTFAVQRITDPIRRLIVASEEIAGGKFGQQIPVHTGDEIEELSKQFNRMSARLAESYAALKEREERMTLVIQGTNDGIWDWNLETNEVYFSPRWKAMLGYADEEISNRFEEWRRLTHPDDIECAMAELRAYLDGQMPVYQLEHRLRHKDGSYRWVLARGIALRHPDGKPYRMAGSHTDITERKHAEEAIRQSEKRFAQVFRASPIPITITTLGDGRYVEVNEAWLRLFGYTHEQVIDRTSLDLSIWVSPDQRQEMISQLEADGALRDFEHLVRCKSGDTRDVLLSAEVIEINDVRYNLSLLVDITERKQAQQALEQRVAERTHELATLNAIAEVVSGSLDLKEILNAALTKALQVMRMDVGTAYSVTTDGEPDDDKELVLAARIGLSDEFSRRVGSRRVRGTAIQVAAEAQRPVVWLVANYPDLQVKQALELEEVRQVVNVPLFAKGKFVGAFNLGTRRERTLTQEELSLLAGIGHQVAIAVENAHLYDQAEQSAALAERTRLARELHDSVTQSIYSVTMYAEAAQLLLTEGEQNKAAAHLRELRDTAQEALGEMRLLIYELRPLSLEKHSLAEALQERVEAVEARGGIRPEIDIQGESHLPLAVQHELYHIAREALNNTVKHAHAHTVRIQLHTSQQSVCLEIQDDGVGFDPANTRGGLGLAGMQERVQRLRGTLEITSAPKKGTQVKVILGNSFGF